jgi:hypothetical protein
VLKQEVPDLWTYIATGIKLEGTSQEVWSAQYAKALTIMSFALALAIGCKCMNINTPALLLVKLDSLYALKDVANILLLKSKLQMLKLVDGLPLKPHLDSFDLLIQQLEAVGAPTEEAEVGVTLLLSLPPSWQEFRGSLALQARSGMPLTLEYVKRALIQKEAMRSNDDKLATTSTAFYLHKNGGNHGRRYVHERGRGVGVGNTTHIYRNVGKGISPKCYVCGSTQHKAALCSNTNNAGPETCSICGGVGHRAV